MGAYTIILSITAMFELVATAGLPAILVRGIAADRSTTQLYVSGSVGVALLASGILVPVMLLVVHLLHYPAEVATGIRLLSCTIVLTTIQQYAIAICEGLQNMKLRAIVSTLDTAGRLIVGVFLVTHGHGVVGLVKGMILMRFATATLSVGLLEHYATVAFDYRVMIAESVALLRASVPFLLITVTNTIYWSTNTVMLSKTATLADVGAYSAAYRIMDIVKSVVGSYLIVLLPIMSASFSRSMRDLERDCNVALKYLALLTFPIATGISVLAARIIRLVYGGAFEAAVPHMQVLIWTSCAFCLALVFARILIASHNQTLDLYCNVASLIINAALCWILLRRFGAIGASIATLVSLTLFGVFQYLVVARKLFRPAIGMPVAQATLGSLIMALGLSVIKEWPLAIVVPFGAVVYAGAVTAFGTFSTGELLVMGDLAQSARACPGRLWRRSIAFARVRRL
jgi:O-antigen/teichoic acid export membrane protein